jgi:UDP-apiose/xylose synthase
MTAPSPRRIAVLGAGGFIGSHLVPALLAAFDCPIEAIDADLSKLEIRDPRVERRLARIQEPGLIDGVVRRCDLLISLTALCTPALYNTDPLAVIDASYNDLLPVVRGAVEQRARLIHLSTCEVYGRRALDLEGRPMERMNEQETALFLGPVERERWTYACAKQLLERVIWAYGSRGQLDFTIVRPFNVVGARMDFLPGIDGEGVPRVLASFMNALLRGQPLELVDGGAQRRSFIAVEEFVSAIVSIVARPAACNGEIINLGNPRNDTSIRALGEALAAAYLERVPEAQFAGFHQSTAAAFYGAGYDDTSERIPDLEKAERLLDFHPTLTLAAMLPAIVDDYVARYAPRLQASARVAGAPDDPARQSAHDSPSRSLAFAP